MYEKVCLLDIDMMCFGRMDDAIFDLPAPAALKRGQNNMRHGDKIDGSMFFNGPEDLGGENAFASWGQATGEGDEERVLSMTIITSS
jgi:hypothetical protein